MVPIELVVFLLIGAVVVTALGYAIPVLVKANRQSPLTNKLPKHEWLTAAIILAVGLVYAAVALAVVAVAFMPYNAATSAAIGAATPVIIGGMVVIGWRLWMLLSPHAALDGVPAGAYELLRIIEMYKADDFNATLPEVISTPTEITIWLLGRAHELTFRSGVKTREVLGLLAARYAGSRNEVTFYRDFGRWVATFKETDSSQ